MTIRERLSTLISGTKAAALPLVGQTLANRMSVPSLSNFKLQIQEGLYKNSAVQGCVMALSSTMNEAPLIVIRTNGDYVENHPIERLFARPNPHMSGSQFWRYVTMYVYTGGNAYIHKVRSDLTGAVVELYPYHSGQMVPVPSQYGWIEGYNYMVDGQQKFVQAKDVIHIKWTPDPLNPTVGLSPIDVAGAKIQALNEIDQTIYSQMKNNGVPGHLMFLPQGVVTETQRNQLRQMWEENFTGSNRGKLGVMQGDVRIERLAMNMSELQSEGLYGQLESAICGVYRVHPVVAMVYAGLLSSTYSNMETAFREFTTLTRVPTWKDWADQLTIGLRDELAGLLVAFDTTSVEALKSDPDAVIYPVIAMFNSNLITQNEARERTGQAQVEDGDIYSYQLLQNAATQVSVANSGSLGGPLVGESDKNSQRFVMSEDKAVAAWKKVEDVNAQFVDKLLPYVEQLYVNAAKQANSVKAGPSAERIDPRILIDQFMKASAETRRQLLDQIMVLAVDDVNADFSEVVSFVDEVEQAVTQQNIANLSEATKTVKKQVAEIINQNAGKSVEEIAQAVTKGVASISEGRARTIAQTVVAQQTSVTQEETWEKMNRRRPDSQKIVKVWITQRDGDVRASHALLDGQWVEIGADFGDGIKAPGIAQEPSDFVGCRCVIRGIAKDRL